MVVAQAVTIPPEQHVPQPHRQDMRLPTLGAEVAQVVTTHLEMHV